jgi:predicted aldo/keto reductase-like oxidoreductase
MQLRHNTQLNIPLSPLGFGVMRLPTNADGTFPPDVIQLLQAAYERGVNYFDTGYLYLNGHSEELVHEALVEKYPRDSFYIADKLPVWMCETQADMEQIFRTQLERLGVNRIDFYLLHGLNRQTWAKAYKSGALDFLVRKYKEGRINHIGFSIHDNAQVLAEILDAYSWDFAQLQINYYDWIVQHAKENYDLLAERHIPCIVMEPIGGGRLAQLPERAEQVLRKINSEFSIASWALRFVAGLPNVAVTLSGMSDLRQLTDNLAHFEPVVLLTEHELEVLKNVVMIIGKCNAIPCTSCRYCLDVCPANVDIPQIFQRWNNFKMFMKNNVERFDIDYFMFVPKSRDASNCISCGECTAHCPQRIDIPRELKKVHNTALELSLGIDIGKLRDSLSGGSPIVCFGAGAMGRRVLAALRECGVKVHCFCDNSERLWGTLADGVEIISPQQLRELAESEKPRILITSGYYSEIKEQLNAMGINALILNEMKNEVKIGNGGGSGES